MSDQEVVTLVVKPLLSEYQEGLVRQTLETCRDAAQAAYPAAKRMRAKTPTAVLAVANVSLASLPAELARSVAESVAHEVSTGGHDGTKGSCRLSWGCVILRKNLRLRLMTFSGERLKGVRVREKDEASLAGMSLASPSYLLPDSDGGFLLKLSLRPSSPDRNAVCSPATEGGINELAEGGSAYCVECGSGTVEQCFDPGTGDAWYCDKCRDVVEVTFEAPPTQQPLADYISSVVLPPRNTP